MSHAKIPAYKEAYDRDGVVRVEGLLNAEQLALLVTGIGKIMSNPTKRHVDYASDESTGQHFFYDAVMLSDVEEFDTAIRGSALAELVAGAMGSESATAFYVSIFQRTGGEAKRTPWHQDQPFWAAKGRQACSTWIPFDPVSRETALEFVRASHKWETFGRPDFSDKPRDGYLEGEEARAKPFPDIENDRDDFDIVGWEVNPGDCLLFHGMTAHGGSGGHLPEMGRRAISIQWLGDDGVYAPKEGGSDPDFSAELAAAGVQPGRPIACDLCPTLWPEPST